MYIYIYIREVPLVPCQDSDIIRLPLDRGITLLQSFMAEPVEGLESKGEGSESNNNNNNEKNKMDEKKNFNEIIKIINNSKYNNNNNNNTSEPDISYAMILTNRLNNIYIHIPNNNNNNNNNSNNNYKISLDNNNYENYNYYVCLKGPGLSTACYGQRVNPPSYKYTHNPLFLYQGYYRGYQGYQGYQGRAISSTRCKLRFLCYYRQHVLSLYN